MMISFTGRFWASLPSWARKPGLQLLKKSAERLSNYSTKISNILQVYLLQMNVLNFALF